MDDGGAIGGEGGVIVVEWQLPRRRTKWVEGKGSGRGTGRREVETRRKSGGRGHKG